MCERKCNNCQYAVLQDTGYSNYTVMGEDLFCLKQAHPDDGFDTFYGRADELNFAKKCRHFKKGEPASFDADGDITAEEAFDGNQELIALWNEIEL